MIHVWEVIKEYYMTLGRLYHVDPLLFIAIHAVASPLFILSASWLVHRYRKKKEILVPVLATVFIFNAANIYLVLFGKNIPWFIYTILLVTTMISGFIAYKKIRKKAKKII